MLSMSYAKTSSHYRYSTTYLCLKLSSLTTYDPMQTPSLANLYCSRELLFFPFHPAAIWSPFFICKLRRLLALRPPESCHKHVVGVNKAADAVVPSTASNNEWTISLHKLCTARKKCVQAMRRQSRRPGARLHLPEPTSSNWLKRVVDHGTRVVPSSAPSRLLEGVRVEGPDGQASS